MGSIPSPDPYRTEALLGHERKSIEMLWSLAPDFVQKLSNDIRLCRICRAESRQVRLCNLTILHA